MRYAIHFTPPIHHPLAIAAAGWLGRNVYSGDQVDHPPVAGFTQREIAFHTALPRRDGFHATMKAPFRLAPEVSESDLLKALMRFAGTIEPIVIEQLEVARLGEFMGCCRMRRARRRPILRPAPCRNSIISAHR